MAVSTHLKCLEVGWERGGAKKRRGQIIPGVHHTSRKGTLGVVTCPYWEVVGQLDGVARPAECPGARPRPAGRGLIGDHYSEWRVSGKVWQLVQICQGCDISAKSKARKPGLRVYDLQGRLLYLIKEL